MRLSGRRQRLLLRTWLELNATALALRLFPLPGILRYFRTNSATTVVRQASVFSKDEIIWTIRAAAALSVGASCAVRALVAERQLRSAGHDVQFKVGVRAGEDFQAHAWVEDRDGILVGASERPYHPLPDITPNDVTSPS